jgi:hypothetical protein
LSALTLTIILGIVVGNTFFPAIATRTAAGVDLSKSLLLRAGIILYGFSHYVSADCRRRLVRCFDRRAGGDAYLPARGSIGYARV